jgi:putative transposase
VTRRKFIRLLQKSLNDSREAVIRYLTAELRFAAKHLKQRPKPTEGEKRALARAAKAVDPAHLENTFNFFQPSTLFRWYRELIHRKWDYSNRRGAGRPRVDRDLEEWVVRLAEENPHDGYKTIAGRLGILGFDANTQTVKNILIRNGLPTSPDRREGMSWADFLETHKDLLVGTDFFTWEVLTPYGLATYYVLFLISHGSRKVHIAGVTTNPGGDWMCQIARNLTDPETGFLRQGQILLHDQDAKYTAQFSRILNEAGIRTLKLPYRSPNLNAFSERFVRTVKEQCLSRMLVTSEEALRKALREFTEHYHHERPHQGIGNVIPLPRPGDCVGSVSGRVRKESRLGSLLNFYHREENPNTTTTSDAKRAS